MGLGCPKILGGSFSKINVAGGWRSSKYPKATFVVDSIVKNPTVLRQLRRLAMRDGAAGAGLCGDDAGVILIIFETEHLKNSHIREAGT